MKEEEINLKVKFLLGMVIACWGAGFFVLANAALAAPPAINYAPNLWFSSEEKYFPADPLEFYYPNGEEISGEIVVPKYNQLSVQEKLNQLTVLYHLEDEGNEWIYEYWFFYVFNDATGLIKNKHYGDWEAVFVFTDKNTGKVNKVIGTAHQREIFDTEIYNPSNNHIWTYVGEGSHANCVDEENDGYCDFIKWRRGENWNKTGPRVLSNQYKLKEITLTYIAQFNGATTLTKSPILGINFRETVGFNGEGYDTQLGGSPPPHAWAQSNYYNPEELRPYSLQMAGEYVSNILSQIQETALGWLGNLSSLFKNSEQSAGISAALFTSMEGLKMQTEAFLADFALADTEPVKIEVAQLPQAKPAIAVLPPPAEAKPIVKESIKEEIKQSEIKEAQPEAQPVEKKIYYGSGGGGGNSGGTSAPIESEKTIFEETTTTTDETTTSTDETATSTEEIDLTPPMAVIDLNANYGDNRGEIKLSWTAPGDADEYIIRWATSTITSSTWDLASDVSGEPAPGAFNERESFTAGELDIGQTYYFALKSTDGTGNISEISNIASSSPSALASSVIISEVQIYDIYDREFVELYNPTNSDIDMSNWHLLYFPSSRDWNNPSSNKEFLNGAVIPAKGYYLIGLNGFSQDKFIHFDWLAPSFPQINNYSGSLVISASSSAATEEVRIDTLGWGSAQYVFEGSPAAAPEQYHSLTRRTAGWDTDDNSADFITKDWPNPRNSLGNSVTIVSDKIKITENSVWDLAGSPYLLESNHTSYPTVTASTTLTIKPGVTVKGVSKDYPSLLVKGVLKAQGTADNPIVFTANTSTPQNGGWSEIVFDGADDGSVLNYVNFEYGGYPAAYGTKTFNEMLRIIGSDVVIQNSTFKNSLNGAVYLENSSSSISNSVFSNNTSTAIVVSGSLSAPTIENCRFENNGGNGIDILSEASPVITNNVFSNNFYPITMISSYPALSGNEATGNNLNGIIVEQDSVFRKDAVWKADALAYVLFSGWGQAPTVATGTVLTIEPGTVIKPYSPYYTALKIEGELVAEGAAGTPIVFTSLKDDDYVGDTNNDGSTTTPTAGDWKDIEFATGSRGRLSHILFRYGPDNINTNANVVLGDNIIYEPKLAPE